MPPPLKTISKDIHRSGTSPTWISSDQWRQFETSGTSAHRICTIHGAWLERLGQDLLFNYQSPALLNVLLAEWKEKAQAFKFEPQRIFGRLLPIQNEQRSAPVLLTGDNSLSMETIVKESGVQYGLDFLAGYSVGLFLDQRGNRSQLAQARPRRVLNTFAYTCSFSVVGALAGAETLSVDLSQKSLERGKLNFSLNGLDISGHRFIADDVQDLLPRLARRKELFDAVILDPPTFSRGNKGRRFRAEDDLQSLLCAALEVTAPGGRVLLSTNCTKLTVSTLEAIARFALKNARLNGVLQRSAPLADFPPGTTASTLWIQLR